MLQGPRTRKNRGRKMKCWEMLRRLEDEHVLQTKFVLKRKRDERNQYCIQGTWLCEETKNEFQANFFLAVA